MTTTLRARWLGRVSYSDAYALQKALFTSSHNHLLLLEHAPVFTLGARASLDNLLVDPAVYGAEVIEVDRGGDITWHGPGQLVGYPILSVPGKRGGGMADTVAYVASVEQLIIDTLVDLGLTDVGRLDDYPGVWVDPSSTNPRKIAAIGVRLTRGRSMHGFALNVDPDLVWFDRMVPCGITDKAVTSLAEEGIHASMRDVVDALLVRAEAQWGQLDRQDVVWRERVEDLTPFSRGEGPGVAAGTKDSPLVDDAHLTGTSVRISGRLAEAGVTSGLEISSRKPDWMRVKADMGPEYRRLKSVMKSLDLVTVCEEAGCPNIFDCWNDGTATFMVCGERCTRKCGFCLVDTRHPEAVDPREPGKVAEAVEKMNLDYAVITMVARDDLVDGGAGHVAQTIRAIRDRRPDARVEVLISDCKGEAESLDIINQARPDVLNHNIETVPRLQRVARPSASYARSLAVLGRAKAAGLTTKSSIIVGMGESFEEVTATMADLAAVGVDIVTIGQYLRPTSNHLPVARWVEPAEFDEWKRIGEGEFGLSHVEASPLTRSSYHAKQGEEAARV
ncbi:MAG: lipoyl synthase [Acidimicrobiia bacterium]|nr:lipoyl synthase [Acidimicrobiia bacterium]